MIRLLLCGVLWAITASSWAQNPKTYIPKNAYALLPIFYTETARLMPTIPEPAYFGALAEQESCIHLTHKRCMSPTSRLLTQREDGQGLFQVTRAYRADGSIRFDTLAEMRKRYYSELKELSWTNVAKRPDLQIRTAILMIRENYIRFSGVKGEPRLQMADAAYNGGVGGTLKEQLACGLAKGCDPQQWFNHVERYCLKSKKKLYGDRSACDINREHPATLFKIRLGKYQRHYAQWKATQTGDHP